MKALVIGGSGFIGTSLISCLLDEGHDIVIFDKNPSKTFPERTVLGDVRDIDSLNSVLAGVDVVYNLAAEHRDDVTPTSLYYDVNVQGAKNIVEAVEINGIRKIIFTSSVAVYGLNRPNPSEGDPTSPFNHYGKSKLQAEQVFDDWADKGAPRSLVTVRPVVVFGEGNRGNVYNLVKQIESGRFMMVGRGENRKSMAYVGNVARFLTDTLKFGEGRHLFNVATKPDLTVNEQVTLIKSELGIKGKTRRLPYWAGLVGGYVFDVFAKLTGTKTSISSIRIRKFCANTAVATDALDSIGFRSPYTIEEGLKRTIANLEQDIYFEGGG